MRVKEIFVTFSDNTTVHGLKFVATTRVNRVWRVIWVVAFCCCLLGLSKYIHDAVQKYRLPDLSIRVKQRPTREFPFPAITICTPQFAKPDFVNVNDRDGQNESAKAFAAANYHACDPAHLVDNAAHFERFSNDSVVGMMRESSYDASEIFSECGLGDDSKCRDTLTDYGFCYTSNMRSFNEVYNPVVSRDFYYQSDGNESRADGQFRATLAVPPEAANNTCPIYNNVLTVIVHPPYEAPLFTHPTYTLPVESFHRVKLKATSYKTDGDLHGHPADVRGCYFRDEFKLKFFKAYTKQQCEMECLAKYTYEMCGCVKFSMPRDNSTKVCGVDKVKCYTRAIESWPEGDETYKATGMPCECRRACNSVEYSIESMSKGTKKSEKNKGAKADGGSGKGKQLTNIDMKFGDYVLIEYTEYAEYKFLNLIADIGGLLGLFIGCSLMSLLEVFYCLVTMATHAIVGEKEEEKESVELEETDGGANGPRQQL